MWRFGSFLFSFTNLSYLNDKILQYLILRLSYNSRGATWECERNNVANYRMERKAKRMNVGILSSNVEELRGRMIRIAKERGSLVDEHVVEISQELDQLLVQLQTQKDGANYPSANLHV